MELRLLIVEDDALLAEAAADYFTGKGWSVEEAEDGIQALERLETQSYHLILLDVMIPGVNGFDVCRRIRKDCDVPVIFITARVMEEDMLNGYALGADDYVTKPFSLPVLYAKAMALTGRVQGINAFVELGGLKADIRSRSVQKGGEIIPLPPKEYEMLLFRFWGYDFDGNERVVDNHIKKLRKAIGSCGCTIETVRKFGYRLSTENGNP